MWEKLKARLKAQGLTEEQIQAIADGMKEDSIHLSAEENIDVRYNKLKAEKEGVDNELKIANTTIKDLKKNNADVEELQNTIRTYETNISTMKAEHQAELTKLSRQAIDKDLMIAYKAKNEVAVKALVGEIEAKTDDDYKAILESKLKELSASEGTSFMFDSAEQKLDIKGATQVPGQVTNPTVKDTSKMTYSELCAYMEANPDVQI